jgi:aryl-alcohol dehydrogenase-like predicted oxidoreductase
VELRSLGQTGVRVSELCLGAMTFGNEADESASKAIVDRYLEIGGNFVDTADVYSRGKSEEITGRALGSRRDKIVLATKGRMPMSKDPNDVGASRRYLIRAVEASLTRLGTDWIVLYQIHWPDRSVPIEETLSALNDRVIAGKIRYYGLSNYIGW